MNNREVQRSPVTRLGISDRAFLFYLQIVFAAVSIITGVLQLFRVRNSIIKRDTHESGFAGKQRTRIDK